MGKVSCYKSRNTHIMITVLECNTMYVCKNYIMYVIQNNQKKNYCGIVKMSIKQEKTNWTTVKKYHKILSYDKNSSVAK